MDPSFTKLVSDEWRDKVLLFKSIRSFICAPRPSHPSCMQANFAAALLRELDGKYPAVKLTGAELPPTTQNYIGASERKKVNDILTDIGETRENFKRRVKEEVSDSVLSLRRIKQEFDANFQELGVALEAEREERRKVLDQLKASEGMFHMLRIDSAKEVEALMIAHKKMMDEIAAKEIETQKKMTDELASLRAQLSAAMEEHEKMKVLLSASLSKQESAPSIMLEAVAGSVADIHASMPREFSSSCSSEGSSPSASSEDSSSSASRAAATDRVFTSKTALGLVSRLFQNKGGLLSLCLSGSPYAVERKSPELVTLPLARCFHLFPVNSVRAAQSRCCQI